MTSSVQSDVGLGEEGREREQEEREGFVISSSAVPVVCIPGRAPGFICPHVGQGDIAPLTQG